MPENTNIEYLCTNLDACVPVCFVIYRKLSFHMQTPLQYITLLSKCVGLSSVGTTFGTGGKWSTFY